MLCTGVCVFVCECSSCVCLSYILRSILTLWFCCILWDVSLPFPCDQGDILDLINTPIASGNVAAFSSDCNEYQEKYKFFVNKYEYFLNFSNPYIAKEYRKENCSFNAGVFVADLDAWREQNITGRTLTILAQNKREALYGEGVAGDGPQPLALVVFDKFISPLSYLWHVRMLGGRFGEKVPESLADEAHLLHWTGREDPWSKDSQGFFLDKWKKYAIAEPKL
eukprot:m.125788 g.125788  ORF g.125788 m.125788 type:complete len:223 (-) comp23477_c0_seq3:22-690(-)